MGRFCKRKYSQTEGGVRRSSERATVNNNSPSLSHVAQLQARFGNTVLQRMYKSGQLGSRSVSGIIRPLPLHSNKYSSVTLQRRKVRSAELDNAVEGAEGNIFDSRISKGKIFSKAENIADNAVPKAIGKYISTIRTVAANTPNYSYSDKKLKTLSTQMPGLAKWSQKSGTFMPNVLKEYDIKSVDSETLFDKTPNRTKVHTWLSGKEGNKNTIRNINEVGLIDPFLVDLTLNSQKMGETPWEIRTQFADSGTGYITKVKVGTHDITGGIVTRGEFDSKKGEDALAKDAYIFSSTHEQGAETFATRVGKLTGHKGSDKKGTHGAGLDAITWLAAEGARFKPVGELGDRARPETKFIYKPNDDNWTNAKAVTLSWLMQNWGKPPFSRKYGIESNAIADVVKNKGTDIDSKPADISYNLSKGMVLV